METSETGLLHFLKTRKKFWLLPLVLVLAFFALLVIAGSGSEGNFVYTLD